MASNAIYQRSARPKQVKRKVVTSCVECYRRKQKCDRMRPCNFCSARGVPNLCHYDAKLKQTVQNFSSEIHGESVSSNLIANNDRTFITNDTPLDLLDQVGYSSVSRRDELGSVGEFGSENTLGTSNDHQPVAIRSAGRYLDLVGRLPPERLTNELVDAHFSAENWSFSVLDEHHFRKLHQDFQRHLKNKTFLDNSMHIPAVLATFPALLFAVLAVALQFVSLDTVKSCSSDRATTTQHDRDSERYLEYGQELLDLFKHQKPTTSTIEYHLVRMAWLKNYGRGSEAWQCLGIALRQAQEIDLHQVQEIIVQNFNDDLGRTLLRLWEVEHQKRLWARIFIMDSHMAVALGRPRGIHREDCSTQVPFDCDYPSDPLKTLPMNTNHNREPPNAFSPVMFSIALGNKYHDLMSIRASRLDLTEYERIYQLHYSVQSLLTELPPSLRPSFADTTWDYQKPQLPAVRLRLLTTANIFLLALHRPYVSTHITSRDAALGAALAIMQAQQTLFNIVPQAQHKLFPYSFYTIDAGVFLTATLLKFPAYYTDTTAIVLQELQNASQRLGQMKEKSSLARTGEVVIQRCCSIVTAHMPSTLSIGNYEYMEPAPKLLDLTTSNFLQGFGTNVADQATKDLISMLAGPPISVDSSMVKERLYPEGFLSAFDVRADGELAPTNFANENIVHWPT